MGGRPAKSAGRAAGQRAQTPAPQPAATPSTTPGAGVPAQVRARLERVDDGDATVSVLDEDSWPVVLDGLFDASFTQDWVDRNGG